MELCSTHVKALRALRGRRRGWGGLEALVLAGGAVLCGTRAAARTRLKGITGCARWQGDCSSRAGARWLEVLLQQCLQLCPPSRVTACYNTLH